MRNRARHWFGFGAVLHWVRPSALKHASRSLLQLSCSGHTLCCNQIDFGLLVATSTANIVAVLRTLPAIVMSAFATGGCCSASPSRRVLTL